MHFSYTSVCVVGLGYIGLPTAAMFARSKVRVLGVDINQHAVETINRGMIHIVEPGLGPVVLSAVSDGYLRASGRPEAADAFIIAVPTPFMHGPTGAHHPDISYIEAAARAVAPVLKAGDLVVLESTSPVGTTEQLAAWLSELCPGLTFPHTHGEASDIRIAYCPERVLPGKIVHELVKNDRVVGGITSRCSEAASQLYKIFVDGQCFMTDARTAEMCKLTENSFRDVNIAFANELSIICDEIGVDVWNLINLANRHPRVKILQPGPGVGGHCIAVDPWFVVSRSPENARIIRCAREINDGKPGWVVAKVKDAVRGLARKGAGRAEAEITVSCLGLAFKADIDDMRESPAVDIVRRLAREHAGPVLVAEPHVDLLPDSLRGEKVGLLSAKEAIDRADVVVLLVDHQSFGEIDSSVIGTRILVDTRGFFRFNQA
jgi:UDP-N-acetyl-D-mannosaminuronic acid dehydrogenase